MIVEIGRVAVVVIAAGVVVEITVEVARFVVIVTSGTVDVDVMVGAARVVVMVIVAERFGVKVTVKVATGFGIVSGVGVLVTVTI